MSHNFIPSRKPKDARIVRGGNGNGGTKAIISLGTLFQLVMASRKHCAVCKAQLDVCGSEPHRKCESCKLKFHLGVADALLKKTERKSKLSYDSRCRRRALEEETEGGENDEVAEEYGGGSALTEATIANLSEGAFDALDIQQRPTRW